MEKIEGIILIIVVLAGIVGLYFIYAGVGFAGLQLEQKEYLREGQDNSLRLFGGLTPKQEGEFLIVNRPPQETTSKETGKITLLGFEGSKVRLRVENRLGTKDLPLLGMHEVWSDEILAIRITDVKPSRGEAIFRFLSMEPQICVGGFVFSYELKRSICPDLVAPAEKEWGLKPSIFRQTTAFP